MPPLSNIGTSSWYNKLVILFEMLFLFFTVLAVFHVSEKPFLSPEEGFTYPYSINDEVVQNDEEVEFLVSNEHVGDAVHIDKLKNRIAQTTYLVNYYRPYFIIFDALIAVVIFGVGVFVFFRRWGERASLLFHLTSMAVAADIIGTKTLYSLYPSWLGYALSAMFFLIYTIVPVLFVHFTFVFPTVRWNKFTGLIVCLYAVGIFLAVRHAWIYFDAASRHSLDLYRATSSISMLQNGFVFMVLIIGVLNFILSYKRATTSVEKKKIQWILYGLSIGPAPFILLWVLPIAIGTSPWIPEIIFKFFLMFIPLTFAVSIVKHHAMDIDLIINRSTVYGIVIGAGLVAYLAILGFTANIITTFTSQTSLIISTITAAFLAFMFEPARRQVQRLVDRSFFRVQYDFRHAQHNFIEEIKQCFDVQSLADLLVNRIDAILPCERIGYFRIVDHNRIQVVAHKHFNIFDKHSIQLDVDNLQSKSDQPIALDHKIEPNIKHITPDPIIFDRWGIAIAFPMISEKLNILGYFVLGEKKSGMRFSAEDIDLLISIVTQAGLTVERIVLQQNLLLEKAETLRLEELNKLKSYFVSSVSHDLKTPLTSIKMFAELLRTGKNVSKSDSNEYLEIIEGESERLTRLINNVLDFSRIERGVKEYHFNEIELNSLIQYVLKTMHYQFKIENCKVHTKLCEKDCYLRADKDAVTEALMNLISNAIKYSHDEKEIAIRTFRRDGFVALQVKDNGIGIAVEEIEHIFKPFYRAKEMKTQGRGGTGLGLAIVKHVMDAHKGHVEIQSTPGEGSAFTLLFPLSLED